ncbi:MULTISPECIES: CDP-alcohol phosphatidyltransferase family protein [Acidobacteriaceae]|uniref:CDP-alcohol phosphatidyltransferase family protein n=1 Tax=Acidobacteriaceae TaxID=204434 RepID=UPI00131BE5CB|nr:MULTISPECIES: CDP-alcohol phosphatidyltransferase family protein [Acidobacteriaceae]MDW5264865.1 CDP-alcohol phosphatidyltransferase family protein [Edaphobacter sp.]
MRLHALLRWVPWVMVGMRALFGPLILIGTEHGWLGGIVIVALLSDIYDGILARRWGVETASLRVSDSIADTIFYLGVVGALLMREPGVIWGNLRLFAALFSLEVFRCLFDFWKYRKTASYHSYLAKCWGLVIVVAVVAVLSFDKQPTLIVVALVLGIVVNLEGLAMSLILPRWKNDVKTLGQAWALRKIMLAE